MFATFPSFSKLDYASKEVYRSSIAKYPAFSDISFSTLMIWWNLNDRLSVACLDKNLIIRYELPGDVSNSGLSLIGTHEVDSAIQKAFDHLLSNEQSPSLVHVPEFVVQAIRCPERLSITEEFDYNEYIVPVSNFFPLIGVKSLTRWKVNKFLKEVGDKTVKMKSLDLRVPANREKLLRAAEKWQHKANSIDGLDLELEVICKSVNESRRLGMKNLCLFVDGELCGFALFHLSHNNDFMILNHMRVNYEIPRMFDYLTFQCAAWAARHQIQYMNFEMDLGIPGLRLHKSNLGPVDFLRKFRIEPKLNS